MTQPDLSRVPNGGTLRELPSGLAIIRRTKHEWVKGLDTLPRERLKRRTGKVDGSKFFPSWPLDRLTDWIEEQITREQWTRATEVFQPLNIPFDDPVGLADGEKVHTIRIVCDGHYVHAYPVKD